MKFQVNFSITQLEYIWAVYQYGHFGKAAEQCHVTQPTLSMQVQKFEADLGVTVFDRSKKPILLTEVGEKIIHQIQSVLNETKKIQAIVESSQTNGVSGELILGVIPTIAPYLLPLLLPVIEKKFPELKLKIIELQTQQILEQLENDILDVGLLALPLGNNKYIEHGLFFEQFFVLTQKTHPLAKFKKIKANQLDVKDIWLLEEGHCLRNQILDLCSKKKNIGVARKYQFESGSLETLKNLVVSYGGYTLVPSLAVDHIQESVCLRQFERPIPSRQVGLIYQRTHYKQKLIESLAEVILSSVPDELRDLKAKDLEVLPIGNS